MKWDSCDVTTTIDSHTCEREAGHPQHHECICETQWSTYPLSLIRFEGVGDKSSRALLKS